MRDRGSLADGVCRAESFYVRLGFSKHHECFSEEVIRDYTQKNSMPRKTSVCATHVQCSIAFSWKTVNDM